MELSSVLPLVTFCSNVVLALPACTTPISTANPAFELDGATSTDLLVCRSDPALPDIEKEAVAEWSSTGNTDRPGVSTTTTELTPIVPYPFITTDLVPRDEQAAQCKDFHRTCYADKECCKWFFIYLCYHFTSRVISLEKKEGTCEPCLPGEPYPDLPDPPQLASSVDAIAAQPWIDSTPTKSSFVNEEVTESKLSSVNPAFPTITPRCKMVGEECDKGDDCCFLPHFELCCRPSRDDGPFQSQCQYCAFDPPPTQDHERRAVETPSPLTLDLVPPGDEIDQLVSREVDTLDTSPSVLKERQTCHFKGAVCHHDYDCCILPFYPLCCHFTSGGGSPFDDNEPEGTCGYCEDKSSSTLDPMANSPERDMVDSTLSSTEEDSSEHQVKREEASGMTSDMVLEEQRCTERGETCTSNSQCCKLPNYYLCCHFTSGGGSPFDTGGEGTCEYCDPHNPGQARSAEAVAGDYYDEERATLVTEDVKMGDTPVEALSSGQDSAANELTNRDNEKECGHYGDPCHSNDDCCQRLGECWCCTDYQVKGSVFRFGPWIRVGECKVCTTPQLKCLKPSFVPEIEG
jgi:hypothetical protein